MASMIDYDQMESIVQSLLAGFGTTYYLKRSPVTVVVAGEETTTTPAPVKITGVRVNYKNQEIDGKLIITGDMGMVITAKVPDVSMGDRIVVDNKSWRVINASQVKPAEKLLAIKLQLRPEA